MGTGSAGVDLGGYFPQVESSGAPAALRNARLLLVGWALFTLVWFIAAVLTLEPTARGVGALFGVALPELVGGFVAWRAAARWPLFTLSGVGIVFGLADLAEGGARGLVQVVVPVIVLILLVRARRASSSVATRSSPAAERGSGLVEYAGLVVVAALILGALTATGLPQKVSEGTSAAVCRIFAGEGCGESSSGTPAGGDRATSDDRRPVADDQPSPGDHPPGLPQVGGKKGTVKPSEACDGFMDCLWHYTGEQVVGFATGVGKSAWQMVEGAGALLNHPEQLAEGMAVAALKPEEALKSIFLGDAEEDFQDGNWGEALGDVLVNTGSIFIPGADIAAAAGDLGKAGRLGRLGKAAEAGRAGRLGPLGRFTGDAGRGAQEAANAARNGDVAGAQRAADNADRAARDARDQARKDGCRVVALAPARVRTPLHFGGRFTAPLEGACSPEEQSDLDKAEQDKKNAEQSINDAWSKKATFAQKQLQHEYNKADKGFDIKGNWNNANGAKYEQAIRDFVNKPRVRRIRGTYRGDPALFFYDDATKKVVYLHPDGRFWGTQIELKGPKLLHLTRDAKLGGG